jgi:hypothetical protein
MDLVLRFLIGGAVVSTFAIAGDLIKPRSFGGLFGAAPSVALATLALTDAREGPAYAAVECHSMSIGAIALGLYAWLVCRLLMRRKVEPLAATLYGIGVWFAAAFGLWWEFLR